jgi:hypothetical protein
VSIELFKTKLNSTHNRSSTPPRNPLWSTMPLSQFFQWNVHFRTKIEF